MNGSAPLNVVCVLRSGGDFDAEYVERLRDGVAKHLPLPHRFLCLSNVPVPCERIPLEHDWPNWWSKMEMFRPDIDGDFLFFDLDTVIVGDLTEIAQTRQLTMLTDFKAPADLASGVMYLPWFERSAVWRKWIADPARYRAANKGVGDGGFLRDFWKSRPARWQDEVPGQIVSYKEHVRVSGKVPDDARVVCFHGVPRPRTIGWLA